MNAYDKPSPLVYLAHHGIKGQKWGVRRFQNKDGSYTPAGKERYGSDNSVAKSGEAFVQSIGSSKTSDLAGSVDPELVELAAYAVTTLSVLAISAIHSAAMQRAYRKSRMQELERLKDKRKIKSFEDCPKLAQKMTPKDSMKVTNPDFPDLGTTMNCTFCTTAMTLREKGYDVKAAKIDAGMFTNDFFKATFNASTIKMGKKKSGNEVIDTLSKNGDGAYGNLTVHWNLGGGHSVFWKNEGGRTRIYDGQSGDEITSSSSSFRSFMDSVDLRSVEYNRLDNCEPTVYALAVVEDNTKK